MFFANAINAAPAIQDTGKWILHLTAAATPTPAESGLLSADQFGGYAVTAVFTIINVLIAYLVLKHFVFKPIIKLLNNRRTAVMNELDEADKKTKEAQKLIDEANSQIERAKSDASTIVTDARVQAEKQSHTIVNAAQTEANHIVERASEDSKRMGKRTNTILQSAFFSLAKVMQKNDEERNGKQHYRNCLSDLQFKKFFRLAGEIGRASCRERV